MACTNISGLDDSQKKEMFDMIHTIPTEDAPKENYSISFRSIELHRQNSLWYGGGIASISYKGFNFSVEARGDIRAYLCDAVTDEQIVYIKDKTNSRIFYDQMRQYLRSDQELEQALANQHNKYHLTTDDCNWWEIFVFDKTNQLLCETWVADADHILPAVIETLKEMDEYLDEFVSHN